MNTGKLFSFDGRVGRQVYWLTAVGLYVIEFILIMISQRYDTVAVVIAILIAIPLLIISLATAIKRWHDRGKCGWWMLIALVPFIGAIWTLVECGFLPGTVGANSYGEPESGSPLAA